MAGSDIELTASDGRFSAYLARPQTPNGAALVVLQEIFGVNANIRAIADAFAAGGYVASAPDIFWRQERGVQLNPGSEADRERATGLMKGLDQDKAVADCVIALDHASGIAGGRGKAAVGYCLGGKLAYLLAARAPIDAAVSYYGVAIQSALGEAASIRGKVLLQIAGDDHLCPPDAQAKIVAAMTSLGDRAKCETYAGVGHAFARRSGATFNAAAADRADAMTRAFLRDALGLAQ